MQNQHRGAFCYRKLAKVLVMLLVYLSISISYLFPPRNAILGLVNSKGFKLMLHTLSGSLQKVSIAPSTKLGFT